MLELGDHRGIVDDADESRIADVAGAYGVELCALARVIQVALDAGEQHPAGKPVVAGLGAADRAIEPARSARRQQLRPAHRVAEGGVGIRLAGAVADGAADIEAAPGPRCQHRRLEQQGRACIGRRVDRAGRVEFVIEAHARNVVGDVGIEVDRERRRVQRIGRGGRDAAEIEIKVLDLTRPVAAKRTIAGRPGLRLPEVRVEQIRIAQRVEMRVFAQRRRSESARVR